MQKRGCFMQVQGFDITTVHENHPESGSVTMPLVKTKRVHALLNDLGSQPANTAPAKTMLAWESAEESETLYHPRGAAREARHIMCRKDLFPIWESLIDESRETDAISSDRFGRPWRIFEIHKRPSCVVPVV